MHGMHILSIDKSHGYVLLSGDFVGAGFVGANEVAHATRAYNGLDVVGWFEVRN